MLKDKPASKARHLLTPADDAEAIAQILEKYGNFKVRRLPAYNQNGLWQVDPNPKPPVRVRDLQEAISQLFCPPDSSIPDTALLFFAGHGLQKHQGRVLESFLATSDVCPLNDKWGVSLDWLRELLQSSPVRQQIVWLDCCHSGGLLNFTKANPGNLGKVRDRCFIAACRSFEVAYEENNGILSAALLQCLNPEQHPDGCVSNYNLIDFINRQLKNSPQHPIFHNSGSEIILTGKREKIDRAVLLAGVCPYKGLACFDFNDEDPKYFYGRTDLTDQLLEKVRQGNFLAVLGASGSGKSSVVRAGLLHQIHLGQRLGGSDSWLIKIFRPGKHPFQRLVEAFVDSELTEVERSSQLAHIKKLFGELGTTRGLKRLIMTAKAARVILVVDQFEEAFTLCENLRERQLFFESLLGALEQLDGKLCLVLTMRADFLGKCAEHEYSGLASKIQSNLVMVKPMNRQELGQAITEPANQVGLEVERELMEQMLADVEGPGSLPLLQYTLTQLWQQRQIDRLTLKRYTQLGGVKETLQKRADEIYHSLSTEEQKITERIFRELTQLGEGTEDTRRQVLKSDLVTSPQSAEILERVLQKLVNARLVVTSQLRQRGESDLTVTVVDVAHEALIRHWSRLRRWVNENREVDRIARRIKAAAEEWQSQGKSQDYLLSGARLAEAENFFENYADQDLLSGLDQDFIQESQAVRDRALKEKEAQIAALEQANAALKRERNQNNLLNKAFRVIDLLQSKPVDALVLAIQSTGLNLAQLPGNLLDQVKAGGVQAAELAREQNVFRGNQAEVTCVAVNPGDLIASSSKEGTVRLWDTQGNPIGKLIQGHQDSVCAVTFSPDGKTLASGGQDKTVRFWDTQGNLIDQLFPKHKKKVSLRPVLLLLKHCLSNWLSTIGWLVVGCWLNFCYWAIMSLILEDKLLNQSKMDAIHEQMPKWSIEQIDSFSLCVVLVLTLGVLCWLSWSLFKIEGAVTSLTFSPDGKYIVTGHQDKKVRLWNLRGKLICAPFQGHQSDVTSVAFSPDSKEIVSASQDGTLQLWNLWGKPKYKSLDWGHVVTIICLTFFLVSPFYLLWRYFRPGKQIGQRFQGHKDAVTSVAFSPDGQYIVSGSDDKTLRLWDNQGRLIGQPFQGHEGAVTSVAFSPDGKHIVSGSRDRKVRLWDIQGDPIRQPLQGHENDVMSVAFSPDGTYIISGSSDGTVRLWDIHSHASENWEDYLQVACNRLRYHPILKNPETEMAKQACKICQQYVWKG
ncbi:MAG: caspase family protein [Pelatocladus maniniholoensis HA4357-MV3]|uniref:Caspase family protein n=1 Tax=Pelatocladus maniniholoensis HA4357-MV3 TaxID=1117104 RepID=A0A9E3HA69_9NOST|nr:caspase family protein [Pelatocladus maniniholoensis HA4357-MV3]